MHPAPRRAAIVLCALSLLPWVLQGLEPAGAKTRFAAQIERLSEAEGAFDTDNLISNERSYLDVIPALMSAGVSGGAYIGVGPDQNFSYIARIRPAIAYIIDVRRDNLLLHLLFKALFANARSRVEYASLLTGRVVPSPARRVDRRQRRTTSPRISIRPSETAAQRDSCASAWSGRLRASACRFHGPTSIRSRASTVNSSTPACRSASGAMDVSRVSTIRRCGSFCWRPMPTDGPGATWRPRTRSSSCGTLEARDAIVPIVGNVSGPHAMRAIASAIATRGERVSAFLHLQRGVVSLPRRDCTSPSPRTFATCRTTVGP